MIFPNKVGTMTYHKEWKNCCLVGSVCTYAAETLLLLGTLYNLVSNPHDALSSPPQPPSCWVLCITEGKCCTWFKHEFFNIGTKQLKITFIVLETLSFIITKSKYFNICEVNWKKAMCMFQTHSTSVLWKKDAAKLIYVYIRILKKYRISQIVFDINVTYTSSTIQNDNSLLQRVM